MKQQKVAIDFVSTQSYAAATVRDAFHGGFGLITEDGIKKPAFYDYELLRRRGDERLANSADDALVARRADHWLAIAVWYLVEPGQKGRAQHVRLGFRNAVPMRRS